MSGVEEGDWRRGRGRRCGCREGMNAGGVVLVGA